MPLQLDLENVVQFFTFLSPIFISVFLLFQSAMKADMKGIVWMFGSFIAWILGMALKSMFHKWDDNKVAAARQRGPVPPGTRRWQRTPIRLDMPIMPGSTNNNTPDYCSVFSGPFSNHAIYNTSMPSLNAIFHGFTLAYIAMGVGNNPKPNGGGIVFLIVLAILALINWAFRIRLYCDKMLDVFVGATLGIACGVGWFFAVYNINPTWVYYGKEEEQGKCVLGKQKFQCTYE
tara:strand:- start:311 stop:1006 length:696 start_codon:yes stop_codon:yes gene_type:complete